MKSALKSAMTVLFVLLIQDITANAQSQRINEYWFNVQSAPVLIVVQKGSRPDKLDEFIENVSHGSVIALKLGCVIYKEGGYEIVRGETESKFNLSPVSSSGSKVLLPKGSHGSYLSICGGLAKVTIVEVKFADGAKWSIH